MALPFDINKYLSIWRQIISKLHGSGHWHSWSYACKLWRNTCPDSIGKPSRAAGLRNYGENRNFSSAGTDFAQWIVMICDCKAFILIFAKHHDVLSAMLDSEHSTSSRSLGTSNPPLVQFLCSLSSFHFTPMGLSKFREKNEPIVLLKLWKVFPACYYISPIPKKKPSKNCFQSYVTVTLGPSLESPGHFSSQEGRSKNLEPNYDYREIFTKFFIWTEIFFVQGVSGACTSAFLDADELKIGFTGPEKFLGLSIEKRAPA